MLNVLYGIWIVMCWIDGFVIVECFGWFDNWCVWFDVLCKVLFEVFEVLLFVDWEIV